MNNINSNNPYRLTTLTAALTLILAAPAFAEKQYSSGSDPNVPASATQGSMGHNPGSYSGKFDQSDTNRDGKLDRTEYQVLRQSLESQSGPLAATTPGLMSKRVKDVTGMDVNNQSGAKIGKIKELVASSPDNTVHAVISVGGFLGIGDTEITMPLDQLAWRDNELTAPTTASKKELKSQPEYDKRAYRKLNDNQIIGELSGGGSGMMRSSQMAHSFDVLDANKDEEIDRSEFSAFETEEMPKPSSKMPEKAY